MNTESNFYTSKELQETVLKCSKTALRNLVKNDGFPAPLKFSYAGKAPSRTTITRYPKNEVDAWIRDKEIEARQGRRTYVAVYPAVQLCKNIDLDSALYHMRSVVSIWDDRKRVFRTVLSHESCLAPESLRWGEMKAGLMDILPPLLSAATAVGIDVEGMV